VPGALRGSDLVVGFERFHVAEAVLTGGAPSARTFLLTELAEVVAEAASSWTRDDDLEARLGLADARRQLADALPGTIADPAGRSDRRFLETFAEIERLVALVASRLFGPARPAAAP
jgi:protein-tyrosine-phosphatase